MSKLLSRLRGSTVTAPAEIDQRQNVDVEGNLSSAASPENVKQSGVEKIEGLASTWTKKGLLVAYLGFVAHSSCSRRRELLGADKSVRLVVCSWARRCMRLRL